MALLRFLARRFLLTLLTLWAISVVVFFISEVLPGDVAHAKLGQLGTAQDIALIRKELGLDRPIAVQYVDWAAGLVVGRWGKSWLLNVPVRPYVFRALTNSAILAVFAGVVIIPISIVAGVLASLRRGRLLDHVITVGGTAFVAIPEFVSSMFLILTFSLWLRWFPASAFVPEESSPLGSLERLVLPVTALALVLFGYISRMVRASMVDELRSAYTRTAILKGLSRRRVVVRHVLRNALLPTVTIIASQVSWLIGGLVVVESVFAYPGIGAILLQSALSKDLPVLEVTVMLLASVLMLSNLVADVLYGVLNPRLRFQWLS